MNLLFDTNILVALSRDYSLNFLRKVNPDNSKMFISIASLAELKSMALQNNWGSRKIALTEFVIGKTLVVEINENLVDTYTQIDAYSQRKNPSLGNYTHESARNMGKNDLWIASTAALLGLTLVTTDADFDHLHNVFFDVLRIAPEELKVR